MPYRYAGCVKPRTRRRSSKSLEWSLMGLLALDVLMQVLSSRPVVGAFFWLAGFACDFALFIVIYLIIAVRT